MRDTEQSYRALAVAEKLKADLKALEEPSAVVIVLEGEEITDIIMTYLGVTDYSFVKVRKSGDEIHFTLEKKGV